MRFLSTCLDLADKYMERADWRDLALVKFCMLALGLIAGVHVSQKCRRPVLITAFIIFVATYIPLMVGFVRVCWDNISSLSLFKCGNDYDFDSDLDAEDFA